MITLTPNDTVLFIGDSITHGGRLNRMDLNHILGHGFQSIICSRLAADNYKAMPRFVNKGVSGNSSVEIRERWNKDVISLRPTIISLLVGINDIGRGLNLGQAPEETVQEYLNNIEDILKKTYAALPDVTFIICEPFFLDVRNQDDPYANIPHPFCEEDFKFLNAVRNESVIKKEKEMLSLMQKSLEKLAARYGVIYVPMQDVFDKYAAECRASYLIWDDVHPTIVGHQIMADRWFAVVEPLIKSAQKG